MTRTMWRPVTFVLAAAVLAACYPVNGTPAQKVTATLHVAYAAGFRDEDNLLAAVAIAVAESSLNPTARNPHPEYPLRPDGSVQVDRGLWQISSYWHPDIPDADCDDPRTAAALAYAISEQGTRFDAWDTWDNGAAQSHYDDAVDGWPALRPLVQSYLEGQP